MDFIIRLANNDDRPAIIGFLREHWSHDHILVQSSALFDWQHLSSTHPGQLNFVLALHTTSQAVLAILGFIPISQFSLCTEWSETFLAIWKARDDVRCVGLGAQLHKYLILRTQPAMIGAVGLSRMVVPIYRALGYQTGLLDHHVVFNPHRRTFSIASGVERQHIPAVVRPDPATRCIPLIDAPGSPILEALCTGAVPRKTWHYVRRRYFQHPFYRYHVFGLFLDGTPRAILIARKVQENDSAVLRVSDYLGDATVLPRFQGALQEILATENAEYLDIYQHGIDDNILTAAGFLNRRQQPSLIVPNYFEPFVAANIELDFAYKQCDPSLDGIRIFRGDADQDRPNQPLTKQMVELDV